ncbi:hypothetical protein BDV27DRAFT_133853 [Aspergillus caelatus]|uniref:Uncharacterized protein n=1 Tax=Aspergillus caelatus TaxID=61420 RepID=A0A5N6ZVC9_9EURO|nr:uncharacterized protein BDV27DRAFT_133853 [Aspergillus caelatus]KAE8360879.1 hypothetical protein BDV27DRAFT_133853 [Aspergillus caelatus]
MRKPAEQNNARLLDIGFDGQNCGARPQQAPHRPFPIVIMVTGILVNLLKRFHVVNAVDKVTIMWETGDIIANPIFKLLVERPTAGYSLLGLTSVRNRPFTWAYRDYWRP